MTGERDELHRLLAERAFRWGDFVLASGRRSDYFFDGKQVTLEGQGLRLAALLMLARCAELGVTAVAGDDGVGPLLGAIVALSAAGSDPPLRAFMIRKAQKEHGTAAKIAGPSNIGNYLAGLSIQATAGFGVEYEGLHGTDERIRIDSIPPIQAAYQQACLTLLIPS